MWANFLKLLVVDVLIPVVKDLIFMAINFFKVRQLRKEKESENVKKVAEYEKTKDAQSTNDDFAGAP